MIDRQSLTICHRSYGTPQTERLLDDLFKWQFDKVCCNSRRNWQHASQASQSPFTSRLLLRCATVAIEWFVFEYDFRLYIVSDRQHGLWDSHRLEWNWEYLWGAEKCYPLSRSDGTFERNSISVLGHSWMAHSCEGRRLARVIEWWIRLVKCGWS